MSFSEKLHELRISRGISQKELADSLGVAQSSINYWEKGQRDPSITVVKKIAEFFCVSLDYLMEMEKIENAINEANQRVIDGETVDSEEAAKIFARQTQTIAAHLDADDLTEAELEDVRCYIEYVKSKRNPEYWKKLGQAIMTIERDKRKPTQPPIQPVKGVTYDKPGKGDTGEDENEFEN